MINILSRWMLGLKNRHFFIIDAIIFLITPLLALEVRLDEPVNLTTYQPALAVATLLFLVIKLGVLYNLGFYQRCWRYAGIDELEQTVILMVAVTGLQTFIFNIYYLTDFPLNHLPRSLPLLDGILSFLFVGIIRLSIRVIERLDKENRKFHRRDRVLIVGAGNAGIGLVEQMQQSQWLGYKPVAFIDDDPTKINLKIRHLPIVGNHNKIPEVVRSMRIRRVIIAMPTAPGRVIREILDICQSIGIQTSTLPGINEILSGRISLSSVRDVQIQDLLRREPIETDNQKVRQFIEGKKVLLTGAGGSIGSELCRQIFKCRPAEIVLLGHGENSIFQIQQELQQLVSELKKEGEAAEYIPNLVTFIADIRFPDRLEDAFEKFKPEIVIHAAAHKHVPLMELNPPEAITNNVRGTKNLVDLALRYDVEHFVMISTDKAVNPTNIMGASKRIGEILVLRAAQKSGKHFAVVRFGNVLGSRGSVVPTFKQQIAKGGPVTITHPDICRYFMTIPEAVQLALQAAVLCRGGEVFMLDMGQPVKIVDLAKDLIRLSGYEVGKDIDIVFSGLRPGEKLFEELFISGEEYAQTEHQKIRIAHNASGVVPEIVDFKVDALCGAADQNDCYSIVFLLRQLIPEYQPNRPPDQVPAAPKVSVSVNWQLLYEACLEKHLWQEEDPLEENLTIDLKLSNEQFFQPELGDKLHQILEETQVKPFCLRVVIAEDAIAQNPTKATLVYGQLKALGIQLKLDNWDQIVSSLVSSLVAPSPSPNLSYEANDSSKQDPPTQTIEIVRNLN